MGNFGNYLAKKNPLVQGVCSFFSYGMSETQLDSARPHVQLPLKIYNV